MRQHFVHRFGPKHAGRLQIGAEHRHVCDLGIPEVIGDFDAGDIIGGNVAPLRLQLDDRAVDQDNSAGEDLFFELEQEIGRAHV